MSYADKLRIRDTELCGEGNWVWPKTDDGAWAGPYEDWEKSHQHKYFTHVKNFDYVVTAGGNCGLYVRQYAKMFKTVYAFEPDPLNFHCMVNNSQFDNVVKMQCALGSVNKVIALDNTNQQNVGVYTVSESKINAYIPMITLDTLRLPGCDLLQLDVEGYEHNVIMGAQLLIEQFRPVIVLETVRENTLEFLDSMKYTQVDQSVSDKVYAYSILENGERPDGTTVLR